MDVVRGGDQEGHGTDGGDPGHVRKPFTVSWDFLDPTSNLCFLRFWWGTNPFKDFDFTDPIPNPQVRRAAASNAGYGEKKDRVWNGAAQERWATVDKDSQHYW